MPLLWTGWYGLCHSSASFMLVLLPLYFRNCSHHPSCSQRRSVEITVAITRTIFSCTTTRIFSTLFASTMVVQIRRPTATDALDPSCLPGAGTRAFYHHDPVTDHPISRRSLMTSSSLLTLSQRSLVTTMRQFVHSKSKSIGSISPDPFVF